MTRIVGDDIARFFSRVEIAESGCWLWAGSRNNRRGGYGEFYLRGKLEGAHRASYMLLVGPIPEGLHIDHLCRVHHCVNPDHLEPVTQAENILRGESPYAKKGRQTHCKHGHEFTPENTRTKANGTRECRTCHRIQERARARRLRTTA